ncbi:hypothetical protein MGAST_13610 [Mycobacterium gastri 'Wayne']|nr:hypothetical protein MGAST_13610 [Mycobacterium gastri 'Wayne']
MNMIVINKYPFGRTNWPATPIGDELAITVKTG